MFRQGVEILRQKGWGGYARQSHQVVIKVLTNVINTALKKRIIAGTHENVCPIKMPQAKTKSQQNFDKYELMRFENGKGELFLRGQLGSFC